MGYTETATAVGDVVIDWALDGRARGTTGDWPLADAPTAFGIAIAYVSFVLVGSLVMSKAGLPAMDKLTYPLRFGYNLVQMMLCSYMCLEAGIIGLREGYGILPCVSYNSIKPPVANVLWLFYISKVLDFMDTVFIITGKKWKQLSFLHVYHHTTIFLFYWLNMNAGYDGDVFLTIVLNGFIHAVMYTYYFVALHTKDIWWKKFMTSLQLIQFMTMNAQALYLMVTGCDTYPVRIVQAYMLYILTLVVLFGNFFVQSYMKGGKAKAGGGSNGIKAKTL